MGKIRDFFYGLWTIIAMSIVVTPKPITLADIDRWADEYDKTLIRRGIPDDIRTAEVTRFRISLLRNWFES